ncbi:Heat shock transcription factor, partial [Coemansia nantahalensis]
IVSDPDTDSWIQWVPGKPQFRVCDRKRFLKALKAHGLKATRYASVSKNFRDYGFKALTDARRRIASADGKVWEVYHNENFRDGRYDLLQEMQRCRPGDKTGSPEGPSSPD